MISISNTPCYPEAFTEPSKKEHAPGACFFFCLFVIFFCFFCFFAGARFVFIFCFVFFVFCWSKGEEGSFYIQPEWRASNSIWDKRAWVLRSALLAPKLFEFFWKTLNNKKEKEKKVWAKLFGFFITVLNVYEIEKEIEKGGIHKN